MNGDGPAGLFITWTVYGTFLPGDRRGWRHRKEGVQQPRGKLEAYCRDKLKYKIELLTDAMRATVESGVTRHCKKRNWKLWGIEARTNHVHGVISVSGHDPACVRDQLKAAATRTLRDRFPMWKERSVWTAKGDIEYLDDMDEILLCMEYLGIQDRKHRDHQ